MLTVARRSDPTDAPGILTVQARKGAGRALVAAPTVRESAKQRDLQATSLQTCLNPVVVSGPCTSRGAASSL